MAPPTDEPLLALDEIQGNVIPGFLKDHQHFLFFLITDAPAAKKCLSNINSRLSSANEVFTAHAHFKSMRKRLGHDSDAAHFVLKNLALTATGLRKLTSDNDVNHFADDAFKLGLNRRSALIGDTQVNTEPGHVSKWLVGGSAHLVDIVLILASDDLQWLLDESGKLVTEFSEHGMKMVYEDRGDANAAPQHGHEQFGFKDNISRPAVRGRWPRDPYEFICPRQLPPDKTFDKLRPDFAEPGDRLVWPGHFIFGYGRQKGDETRKYDPTDQAKGPLWALNGSFMVYRRLRQNTDEFWRFVTRTSESLGKKYPSMAFDKNRFAALLIGRWKSGTPLVRSPGSDIGINKDDSLNHFSYVEQLPVLPGDTWPDSPDADGSSCPFAAHIRKVNPRDQSTDLGLPERTLPRSILRRGITYSSNENDKGLIFVCYQSSIVEQFEFLMSNWVNQINRPQGDAGQDPLLSQARNRVFRLKIADKIEEIRIPDPFIIPTGGEYFFSPSISFFKKTLA